MKTILILGVLVLPIPLSAANFSDNFDSYTPGDNLDESPYWFKPDSCGNLIVADAGGNMVVETDWNGYQSLIYGCLGTGAVTDCVLQADIKYTGQEVSCGFLARISDSTGEGYMGYIYSAYPDIGVTFIEYIDGSGNHTTLQSDYYYPFNQNDWYTLSFQVTGLNPAVLTVSVNGSVNSTAQDSVYNLGPGLTGLGSAYSSTASVFSIDNFSVVDQEVHLNAVTFAGIKALFR